MRTLRLSSAALLCAAMTGCVEPSTPLPRPATVQLTAAQVAAVTAGIRTITTGGDLAWLADSVNLVLREGVVLDSAAISVDIGGGAFYAVSLQRNVSPTTNPYSTFDVIYFDNPSSPTRFVIVTAFARGNVGPPEGVIANLATPTSVLTAAVHFYVIEQGAVTHWRSTAGSLLLGNGLAGGPCSDFTGPPNVTCETADLLVGASVTASTRESGTAAGAPQLTITNGLVRGIRLRFQQF